MAFDVEVKKLNHIRVICSHDPALDMEATGEETWKEYLDNPVATESKLVFHANKAPSVFICNFELSGKQDAKIKDASFKGLDEEKQPKMAFGDWEYQVVKMVLKEIDNPGIIKFKKDSRGWVDDFTMTQLSRYKIVPDIFGMYVRLTSDDQKVTDNAKN